jgi:hypothetical protein
MESYIDKKGLPLSHIDPLLPPVWIILMVFGSPFFQLFKRMTDDQGCFPRFPLYDNPGAAFPLFLTSPRSLLPWLPPLSDFFSNFHSQISLSLRVRIDETWVAHHSTQALVSKSPPLLFPGVRIFLPQLIHKTRTPSREISTLLIASYTLSLENTP